MTTKPFLTIVVGVVCFLIYYFGSLMIGEKSRFETASLSSIESKRRRLLLEPTKVTCTPLLPEGNALQVKEAWYEYAYEMFERIPWRKKIVGVRLCVLFDAGMINDGMWFCQYKGAEKIIGKQRVDSGGHTVFVFTGEEKKNFELPGEFYLFSRMDRPPIVRLDIDK